STKEIAQRHQLGVKTVETHRTELMERLRIHGVAGLVRYAIRVGLVHPESYSSKAPPASKMNTWPWASSSDAVRLAGTIPTGGGRALDPSIRKVRVSVWTGPAP